MPTSSDWHLHIGAQTREHAAADQVSNCPDIFGKPDETSGLPHLCTEPIHVPIAQNATIEGTKMIGPGLQEAFTLSVNGNRLNELDIK